MNSVKEQAEGVPADPTFESTESPPSEVEEEEEEEDMADPNSYFDITLPTSAIAHHRHSKSSDSKDFDFRICMDSAHPDLSASTEHPKFLLSTADELFYQGRILPLYVSQRLRSTSKRFTVLDTPIAVSYSLHPADVNVDVLSGRNSPSVLGSSSPVRPKNHLRRGGGFRWKLLGHRKRSSKVGAEDERAEKIPPERRVHSWISHSGGFPLPTQSSESSSRRSFSDSSRNPSQNLFKAKEFWRRYLKPFILPSNNNKVVIPRSVNPVERKKKTPKGFKLRWRSSTRANTPTHSGILSVPTVAPDAVQGAIAYCKASSSLPS